MVESAMASEMGLKFIGALCVIGCIDRRYNGRTNVKQMQTPNTLLQ